MNIKELKKFIIEESPTNEDIIKLINKSEIVSDASGTSYRFRGKLHREDGPAVEQSNGAKEWYKHGKRHRIDGPAIEYPSGAKLWYQRGKLHRTNGPAVECKSGYQEWWVNGKILKWGISPLKNVYKQIIERDLPFTNCPMSISSSQMPVNWIVTNYCPINTVVMSSSGSLFTIKVC